MLFLFRFFILFYSSTRRTTDTYIIHTYTYMEEKVYTAGIYTRIH